MGEDTREDFKAIAEAARYVQGPADCFERECDEFYDESGNPVDPEPERCSHMTVHYATADDAEAALWLPQMVRLLEEERDNLRAQLELARTAKRAASPEKSSGGVS